LDHVAVAHAHFADHTAGRVLHLLDVGIDDHRARRDQRAGNLHGRRPASKSPRKDKHHHKAGDQMQPYRASRTTELAGHDLATPPSETILIGVGGATRCSTCPSTVSFGPNACMRPSFSTNS